MSLQSSLFTRAVIISIWGKTTNKKVALSSFVLAETKTWIPLHRFSLSLKWIKSSWGVVHFYKAKPRTHTAGQTSLYCFTVHFLFLLFWLESQFNPLRLGIISSSPFCFLFIKIRGLLAVQHLGIISSSPFHALFINIQGLLAIHPFVCSLWTSRDY